VLCTVDLETQGMMIVNQPILMEEEEDDDEEGIQYK
jgi:hypothetical protein